MTSESGLWNTFSRRCGGLLTLKRMENRCDLGTPDVAWCGKLPTSARDRHNVRVYRCASGWVELKETDWPARPETPLHIPKLTKEQVVWAEDWERAGGRVAAMIQAERDYLVVPPTVLHKIFRRSLTRAQLKPFIIGTGEFPAHTIIKRLFE